MYKPSSVPVASTAGVRWSSETSSSALIASVDAAPQPSRNVIVRYGGFRATARGREYTMHVADGLSSREFVLLITHKAFADREARFQDAPDVCSSKLRRELAADPGLVPGDCMTLTAQDLADYRVDHSAPLKKRERAKPSDAEAPLDPALR
jgi:hypothetical protein